MSRTPKAFMEYFRQNYPGPYTVISRPDWHAPKIYAAAIAFSGRDELLEDSKKLVNEVSGMMGAFELRQLIGNTNFEVLRQRWERMRETIAKAEGAQ